MAETAIKRFVVFAFDVYYPHGGWRDFYGSFDSMPAAIDFLSTRMEVGGGLVREPDLYQIVDLLTGETLEGFDAFTAYRKPPTAAGPYPVR